MAVRFNWVTYLKVAVEERLLEGVHRRDSLTRSVRYCQSWGILAHLANVRKDVEDLNLLQSVP